ncbi:hypothetical protein GCM10008938_06630 [Deinococcus roseus]|uniref:Transposase n=1 Tax=Deinococcus roseus TaxID=392414 RepID=A0ABQ2CUX5_9DEIO|nr:hypothetical protein GCM10008938_06630 [Deinococcus roseus]
MPLAAGVIHRLAGLCWQIELPGDDGSIQIKGKQHRVFYALMHGGLQWAMWLKSKQAESRGPRAEGICKALA